MKTIYFDKEISSKTIKALMKELNELKVINNEKIYLYFTSAGGYVDASEVFIDFINNLYPYKDNLIMVAGGFLMSAGLTIFLNTKTKKRFMDYDTLIIFHIATSEIDFRDNQKEESINSVNLKSLEDMKKKYLEWSKNCGLNTKEFKKLKDGEDLIFRASRLKTICTKLGLEIVN